MVRDHRPVGKLRCHMGGRRQNGGTRHDTHGRSFFHRETTGLVVGGKADINRWASVIFRTTDGGNTWTDQPVPFPRLLHDVWSINNQTVIAVGDSGTILRSGDGGITWSLRESGGVRILLGVSFANGSLALSWEIQAPYSGQRMPV